MSRRAGCAVVVLVVLFAAGVIVVWIARGRVEQDRVYCQNNLRELAQFAELHGRQGKPPDPEAPRDPSLLPSVPPGTVVNPALPPDRRLSWVVYLLPTFNQRRQDTTALLGEIDKSLPWDEGKNASAARTRLVALVCPGNPAGSPPDAPAPTQYVGGGGVGPDAAALPLVPFPFAAHAPAVASPRAGCFRYDAPTPFGSIADGLSQSVLFAEVSADPGPWLRGGPSTVRTLDAAGGARPVIGTGGQFGGNHPGGANFAFADDSVRFLSDRISPSVLADLFTIAGGGEQIPGE